MGIAAAIGVFFACVTIIVCAETELLTGQEKRWFVGILFICVVGIVLVSAAQGAPRRHPHRPAPGHCHLVYYKNLPGRICQERLE